MRASCGVIKFKEVFTFKTKLKYTDETACKGGRGLSRNRDDLVQQYTKGVFLELTCAGPDFRPTSYNN